MIVTAANAVTVLQSAVLIAGIWIILFWLIPEVRLDCFRQRMFSLRDELFDYARTGKISFEHPAYRLLRQQMNGYIRYGHQLSFSRTILTWLWWKVAEGSDSFKWGKRWAAALETLDAEIQTDLLKFRDRALMHVGSRIVLGSPVLIFSLVISVLVLVFHFGLKSVGELMAKAIENTATRAFDRRIVEEEAARAAA